ncbi:MAG: TPM domain-containing protein [Burkholderiaceae bacterium]
MPTQCRPGHPASPGGTWLAFWLLLFLLVLPVTVLAQSPQPVPALQARIMDQTGTLDAAELNRIEERLAGFERKRGTQVVVLMLASTSPEDIADFTQRLGDDWKIGRAGVGDGLLFVVAKDDRRMRIAPAKTLEGAIPDILARRILDDAVAPAFPARRLCGGHRGRTRPNPGPHCRRGAAASGRRRICAR